MNILIVGLGLIGGAYASILSKSHNVYGTDLDINAINYAKNKNFIIDGSVDPKNYILKSDLIILSIFPKAIIDFLNKYKDLFNSNQVITDVCGVKSKYILEATNISKPAYYLAHHPMSGSEKNGIENYNSFSFKGKNFIITTVEDNTPTRAIDMIKQIGIDLEMNVSICDYKKHDQMIAYTSDLTHAVAVSLMNSNRDPKLIDFAGRSFLEMTRIANINESLWSEIFIENRDYLLEEINIFINEMHKMKNALENNDDKKLKELFLSSTKIRKEMWLYVNFRY